MQRAPLGFQIFDKEERLPFEYFNRERCSLSFLGSSFDFVALLLVPAGLYTDHTVITGRLPSKGHILLSR